MENFRPTLESTEIDTSTSANNAQSVITPSDVTEEDCDIADIDIPPPMKIQEHSYQTIMSTPNDTFKENDNVSRFTVMFTVTIFNELIYITCLWNR